MSTKDSGNCDLLDRLADEFAARYRNGERPALKEYTDRYPELADDIRELFPAMVQIEQAEEDRREAEEPTSEEAALPRLQQLGDFRILREVGKGGMGIVYEAEQVSLGRHVALKVLPKKMLLDTKAKRRFEREAKAAAKLHHTNIVPVFGVGEQDGLPYYVMQFIQGLGLDEVLDELKRIQGTQGPATASAPAAGFRVSRKDLSAADMAKSLLTGEFQGTMDLAPAPKLGGVEPMAKSVDPARTAPVSAEAKAPTRALSQDAAPVTSSGSGGRLSDSIAVSSSSVSLPGQGEHPNRPKAKKLTYWQSVAQVGAQVAGALDYAHRQGILHRDIKPSNLLLDMHGTVWVTDFGLAKADDQQDITHTGDILGTLRYMPPEAFEGKTDPRGDVYALGLSLYELLAMKPAFVEKERNKLIKQVAASAPARLERLNPSVPRDLVTIVHKAMEREPAQRYQSAAELEADLHRFSADEPIKARPLGVCERAWRWCRHNPGIAGLSAALALILIAISMASALAAAHFDRLAQQEAAAAASERLARAEEQKAKEQEAALRLKAQKAETHALANLKEAQEQRRRAEANFARARAAVDAYFTKVADDQLLQAPGFQKLRRELLQSALAFYQDFLKERDGDRSLRTDLAATHLRVGYINFDLGLEEEALKALQAAVTAYDVLARENPKDLACLEALAEAWQGLGDLHQMHTPIRGGPMLQAMQMTAKYREELARARPGDPVCQRKLAIAYTRVGIALQTNKRRAETIDFYRKSAEIRYTLLAANPDDPALHYGMGESLLNFASYLRNEPDRQEETLALYLRAQEFYRVAVAKLPHMVEYGLDLLFAYEWAGKCAAKLGRTDAARVQFAKAIEHGKQLGRDHPAVPRVQRRRVDVYTATATFEEGQGRNGEALAALREAAGLIEREPAPSADDQYVLACLLGRSLPLLAKEKATGQGEADRAMEALARAAAAGFRDLDRVKKDAKKDLAPLAKRADFKRFLADPEAAGQAQKAKDDKAALARVNLAAPAALSKDRLQNDLAATRHVIGLMQLDLGKSAEAAEILAQAAALREERLKEDANNLQKRADLAATQISLGEVHWQAGRLAEAAAAWRKSLDLLRPSDGAGPVNKRARAEFAAALRTVGYAYARAGLWEDAARCHAECLATGDRSRYRTEEEYRSLAKSARLLFAAGRVDLFASVRAEAMERKWDPKDPFAPGHVARLWCYAECSPTDAARALALAEKSAVNVGSPWARHILALARYRAGKWDAALAAATLSNNEYSWSTKFLNSPLLAMIHHRLGHAELAREWLDQANAEWQRLAPLPLSFTSLAVAPAGASYAWNDVLDFELLLHEASHLITGAAPRADACAQLRRAYLHRKLGDTKKAEAELQASAALRPDDPIVWMARGRVQAGLGDAANAESDFTKALAVKSAEPASWIECGRLLAEQGRHKEADMAFAKATALAPDDLNAFNYGGWWVAAPYPKDLKVVCPPEYHPDPAQKIAAADGGAPLAWQRSETTKYGYVSLRGNTADPVSAYAMTYLYAPEERTSTFLIGGNDRMRVWLNGILIHETERPTYDSNDLEPVPVTLKAGRNTVLCKVNQKVSSWFFCVRADDPFERAMRFAELGLWRESAALFGHALEQRPVTDSSYYVRCIHAHLAAGDTAGAERWLQRFRARHDQDNTRAIWQAYAGVYVESAGKPAQWAELAERALKTEKGPWVHFIAGVAHCRAGAFDKAIARFSETQSDPNSKWMKSERARLSDLGLALAHHGLGHSKEARELLDKVEAWYQKAVQEALASPTGRATLLNLSEWPSFLLLRREAHRRIAGTDVKDDPRLQILADRTRAWLRQRDNATAEFDIAVYLSPQVPRLLLARGRRLAELKRGAEADADFAKAVAVKRDNPQPWRELGRIFAELGQPDRSAAAFAKALDLLPPAKTPSGKVWWFARAGIDDVVVQHEGAFRRLAELRSDDRQLQIAWLLQQARLGRWDQAAQLLPKVIALDPADHWGPLLDATLRLHRGDLDGARKVCQKLLDEYKDTQDPTVARRVALANLLLPERPADMELVLRLVERGQPPGNPKFRWHVLSRALAAYRQGQFDLACEVLGEPPFRPNSTDAQAVALLAMAQHRLGRTEAARASLAETRSLLERKLPSPERTHLFDPEWQDWLRAQILFREAERLIMRQR